jgi:hypothetical protein
MRANAQEQKAFSSKEKYPNWRGITIENKGKLLEPQGFQEFSFVAFFAFRCSPSPGNARI